MAFMSAGRVSMIYCGVPLYSGSMNFSRVDKYLTLSFASFNLSVRASYNLWKLNINLLMFSWPYFLPSFCLYFIKFALTILKSLLFSFSDQFVIV